MDSPPTSGYRRDGSPGLWQGSPRGPRLGLGKHRGVLGDRPCLPLPGLPWASVPPLCPPPPLFLLFARELSSFFHSFPELLSISTVTQIQTTPESLSKSNLCLEFQPRLPVGVSGVGRHSGLQGASRARSLLSLRTCLCASLPGVAKVSPAPCPLWPGVLEAQVEMSSRQRPFLPSC